MQEKPDNKKEMTATKSVIRVCGRSAAELCSAGQPGAAVPTWFFVLF
jgi:hypothetical protein